MRVLLKGTDRANLYCDWSSTQSIENNQSTITLSLVIEPLVSIGSWTDFNGSYLGTEGMTFNGTIPNISSEKIITTKKLTVNHEADGTKKQLVKWKWGVNSPWGGFENPSGSFTITLPTIQRATIPTVDLSSLDIGETIVIKTPRATPSFKHTLKYRLGGKTGNIATDVANQKTWTLPLSLCNNLPNDTSGTMRIYCDTYNDSELVGTRYINITVKVPKDIIPTAAISTTEQEIANKLKVFVKNISKVGVDINTVGTYGSTITTITTVFDGTTFKGGSFSLGLLKKSGTLTTKIIDSRGRTNTATKEVTCIDYYSPKVNNFKVERCNADGVINNLGEYVKVTYDYSIAPINNLNNKSIVVSYSNGNYTDLFSLTDYAKSGFYVSTTKFDKNISYDFKITLSDSFNERIQTYLLASDNDSIIEIDISNEKAMFGYDVINHNDTEWLDISLASTFKSYDTEQTPQYRVRLGVVEIRGAIAPISTFSSSATRVTFANIPKQYAPTKPIYILCQGSGKNTWLLTVNSTGELQISRYGNTAYGEVDNTAWLPFQLTYTI